MVFLYNLSIRFYFLLILLASLWNQKARQWVKGRKILFASLGEKITSKDRIIWVHCSSAGEFEQGKPIIERLKQQFPFHKILVSFFSPSGYAVAKNYPYADIITYLPLDTKSKAQKFLQVTHPELIVFIKYEFWYHHLQQAAFQHIPLILASAVFRKDQLFFKSYGRFYKNVLLLFRRIFVQDQDSLSILKENNISADLGGDTRFDRVQALGNQAVHLPVVEAFLNNQPAIVAGSTWPLDEDLLINAFPDLNPYKMIIAPHEITESHLSDIRNKFPKCIFYSQVKHLFEEEKNFKGVWSHIDKEERVSLLELLKSARVLIIDNVGMLSRLYYYASLAYVGGGFTRDGIHNVLEPAAFGKPVFFGPNYEKYREAREMLALGGAFSVKDAAEFAREIKNSDQEKIMSAGKKAREYILMNGGASEKIYQFIQENRLLTN